jgi:hypothetical protein
MNGANMDQLHHKDVERLAYRFWQERGSPIGSPDEDWFRAEAELRGKGPIYQLPVYAFAMEPTEE